MAFGLFGLIFKTEIYEIIRYYASGEGFLQDASPIPSQNNSGSRDG